MSEDRTTYLGSHSSSALLGRNPFMGRAQIYQQALGIAPEQKPNRSMLLGLKLEEKIIECYEEHTGNKVVRRQEFCRHPSCAYIGATKDGWVEAKADYEEHGVEVKLGNPFFIKDWGQENNQVPEAYYLQCQHHMAVTGAARWHLYVMIGTFERNYIIERDEQIIGACMKACVDAWNEITTLKTLMKNDPDLFAERMLKIAQDDEKAKANILQHAWPHAKEMRQVPEEHYDLFARIMETNQNLKAEEKNFEQLKNKVKAAMKEDGRWKGPGGSIAWSGNPRRFYVRPDEEHDA